MTCDAVILAAGYSKRMKRWKPGLPCGEDTVIGRTVDRARAAGGRTIVVAGESCDDLLRLLEGRKDIIYLQNQSPEKGMLSSVQAGIRGVESDRYFIVLGDMPFVREGTYTRLRGAAGESGTAPETVIVPVYQSARGHPVLLSTFHSRSILQADPESMSLRDCLDPFPERLVDTEDPGIVEDLDTPEDYRRMCGTDLP